jgi:thymidine phosphorylase
VQAIDAEAVGLAAIRLGAGRERKEDAIDPSAFIRLDKKVGERVERGQPLASFAAKQLEAATRGEVEARLRAAYTLGATAPPPRPLVLEVIR